MGLNVERRGVEDVMQGFQLYGVPCFSIWQTQNLKFAYGAGNIDDALRLLEDNLDALHHSQTAATYTLKAHTEADADGFISNKTKYIGSFNFCMRTENLPARQHYQETGRVSGIPYGLQKEIQDLKDQIAAMTAAPPPADDEETDVVVRRIGAVTDLIQSTPGFAEILSGLASKFLGVEIPAAGMAGMGRAEDELDTEGLDELDATIMQLRQKDPHIEAHLKKLANIDTGTFKMLIGMLDKM
jgi:hypothetical protein